MTGDCSDALLTAGAFNRSVSDLSRWGIDRGEDQPMARVAIRNDCVSRQPSQAQKGQTDADPKFQVVGRAGVLRSCSSRNQACKFRHHRGTTANTRVANDVDAAASHISSYRHCVRPGLPRSIVMCGSPLAIGGGAGVFQKIRMLEQKRVELAGVGGYRWLRNSAAASDGRCRRRSRPR